MEQHGKQPEPFFHWVTNPAIRTDFGLYVAEQRAKQKDFPGHPANNAGRIRGIAYLILFDPGQRFLLADSRGNTEGHRRLGPAPYLPDETSQENHYCQ